MFVPYCSKAWARFQKPRDDLSFGYRGSPCNDSSKWIAPAAMPAIYQAQYPYGVEYSLTANHREKCAPPKGVVP
jgi:hypothetical protein